MSKPRKTRKPRSRNVRLSRYDLYRTDTVESAGWDATHWQAYLHDRRVDSRGAKLGEAEQVLADAMADTLHPALAGRADETRATALAFGRGLYAHMYGHPLVQAEPEPWVATAVEALRQSDEIRALRQQVAGDPDMTAIASARLVRRLAEVAAQLQPIVIEVQIGKGDQPGDGDGEGQAAAEAARKAMLAAAIAVAASAAADDVAEARDGLNGILPGLGNSDPRYQDDPRRLELVDQLANNKRLRQILRIAGRIHRVADRVRMVRSPEARLEVVDLEYGADLARVLPSQLAGLTAIDDPDLDEVRELLVLKGLADRSLLQLQTSGHEMLGRGPMVGLLDSSGSMDARLSDGLERMAWAAAIAIAMVRTGVEQRRAVTIGIFQYTIVSSYVVPAGDHDAAEAAVLALAGVQPGGGTSYEDPIRWALDQGAERDRADLVLVTDGECGRLSAPLTARLVDARERGLRLWGVLAGEGGLGATLESMCDAVVTVDPSTPDAVETIGGAGIG